MGDPLITCTPLSNAAIPAATALFSGIRPISEFRIVLQVKLAASNTRAGQCSEETSNDYLGVNFAFPSATGGLSTSDIIEGKWSSASELHCRFVACSTGLLHFPHNFIEQKNVCMFTFVCVRVLWWLIIAPLQSSTVTFMHKQGTNA